MKVHVVYDGLCLFCIRTLRVVRAFDVRHVLEFHDANDRSAVLTRFPQLASVDLNAAMYVVDGSERIYAGYDAFRRIARSTPFGWWLLPLLHFPGARTVGDRVYGFVAHNRSRMGCRVEDGAELDV